MIIIKINWLIKSEFHIAKWLLSHQARCFGIYLNFVVKETQFKHIHKREKKALEEGLKTPPPPLKWFSSYEFPFLFLFS